ncbi:MAG TPA: pyruvate:ferredoxin (flavodoxin) oxidoreductase, partial [Candidatus Kapabacteria bacterium]|nr:pyruvate:ferredoxin (flavodoxin) oxidoreductase [Candidatus Kapabacteria bacterium]
LSEVIAIYPITPSSSMGELSDAWASSGIKNLWGTTPLVQEMQSEGGAAGAIHGALQGGALATTFTSSQGLLLMIPNMYKIAGELTPTVFHIAARSLATHALSIFGDHSDVMSTRGAGWGILFSNSVQEVMDLGLIAHASTLGSRIPFLHCFDGFRTSHEVTKIEELQDDILQAMIDEDLVAAHRNRALSPDHPVLRGTAQNPDVFFQARERVNPFYTATPGVVQAAMDRFAALTGRRYNLFDYYGAPDADRVVVAMGSGCETVGEIVDYLNARGEKVGMVKVRLFRPFSVEHMLAALPSTVRSIAVLDRTKEPGAVGEPLYQDVLSAIAESFSNGTQTFEVFPRVIGGRYGLSSKEFTPAMARAIYDELRAEKPKNSFTVGINDDVSHTSLEYDAAFEIESNEAVRAVFWGLGADGTVGANKNSVKIIGEETENYAQGYFVYDSKKSGARTVSHLRFGPREIHSPYLIQRASFIAVHQFGFVERYDVLENAEPGATLLLNSPFGPDDVWRELPRGLQQRIIDLGLKLFVIDAYSVAAETGMGQRINTIMQVCFFAISGVLPRDEAIERIKEAIVRTYKKRGEAVIQKNFAAVDAALAHLHEVAVPTIADGHVSLPVFIPEGAPDFIRDVTGPMIAGYGDNLPVSSMPIDGTFPVGSAKWEKRNIALEVPVWDTDLCIQCGKCVLVCPHSAIRAAVYEPAVLETAPPTFKSAPARWRELADRSYTLQVAVEDCTGCELCVEVCPAKDKANPEYRAINMAPQPPLRDTERANWDFFLSLPATDRLDGMVFNNVKNIQMLEPLFEFSGACSGCGETPYLKLMTQLFGERAIVANATGCSSIYGGNLPTTPWTTNGAGRGPAWSNSLFEDNAEFGLGIRLAVDKQETYASELVRELREAIGVELADEILAKRPAGEKEISEQRERIEDMRLVLHDRANDDPRVRDLLRVAEALVPKSVWIIGGDGWAYDIGFGGLDHVLASGRNVNLLVLDTEVYSNTGGQSSKSTPLGAVAKFAAAGKRAGKKELGLMATEYGTVYVAQVAMGANDLHTVRAFLEAEAYDGPSIIIAYGHCIVHGVDMAKGMNQQKLAVDSGYWPLYRYNPARKDEGKNPFQLDSSAPKIPLVDYAYNETRYRSLRDSNPEEAAVLMAQAQANIERRWKKLSRMAEDSAG